MSRRYAEPVEVRTAPACTAPACTAPACTDDACTAPACTGAAGGPGLPPPEGPRPEQFLWRGRLYVVREVLAQWVEVGAWWRSAARTLEGRGGVLPDVLGPVPAGEVPAGEAPGGEVPGPAPAHDGGAVPAGMPVPAQRWVWRVEATSGRSAGTGVYDLACDPQGRAWALARALD